MNIEKIHGPSIIDAYTKHSTPKKKDYEEKKEQHLKDTVVITDEARLQQLLHKETIDADRIKMLDDLKKSIDNGTYKIDSKKIAEKIIDFI